MESKGNTRTQMLRLDGELWAQIGKRASEVGKTPRQEIERRLRQSLVETPASQLAPARAIGRLIELHADDVARYCQSAGEWQNEMKVSVPVLLDELFNGKSEADAQSDSGVAVAFARTLAQKVRRAHLPLMRSGEDFWGEKADRAIAQEQPSLATLQSDELRRIQKALGLAPDGAEKLAPPKTTKRGTGRGK